jgi:CheY-like chemotaxis protein
VSETSSSAAVAAGSAPLVGIHVLIVEDDDNVREVTQLIIECHGGVASTAPSATAALEVIDRDPPDVILSDIGMPGHDGYWLLRTLRARAPEQGGNIPAAAVTSFGEDADRRRALAAGFQIHVGKPVDPMRLIEIVLQLSAC